MTDDLLASLLAPRPSARQLRWQTMEFYAFIHFGMNTVNDREWGTGTEDAGAFDLDGFDPDQWVRTMAEAGMRGVILTAKHHDGFCLWPSQATDHSVARSPWRSGGGDIVREVSDAARRHGLAFGVYLSPWDRHDPRWGTGSAYDDYFVEQLTELLTAYGPVFTVWFDGAQGDEPDRRQEYDWDRYIAVIRELQPDAVITVCGPDVRWCGNEAGHTRPNEWSVVPAILQDAERIADASQKVDDGAFRTHVASTDDDLGSREALRGHEDDLVWYPAEVNTSIRPGWFHHDAEDSAVRDAEELFRVYEGSVGGNSSFLLGLAPNRAGVLPEPDVLALRELGRLISAQRADAVSSLVSMSSGTISAPGENDLGVWPGTTSESAPALDLENGTGWWSPVADDDSPALTLAVPSGHEVYGVVIKEEITAGQRLEEVSVLLGTDDVIAASTHSVGYQRILRIEPRAVDSVTVRFTQSRGLPVIAGLAALTRPVS